MTTDVRWKLFALHAFLGELRAIPQSNFIRYIALYGPLANGVEADEIALATILAGTTPAQIHARLWDQIAALLLHCERTYAVTINCLLVSEASLADAMKRPPQFTAIEHEHVIVWP